MPGFDIPKGNGNWKHKSGEEELHTHIQKDDLYTNWNDAESNREKTELDELIIYVGG